ncbi:MAG: HAD family hydrolase [Anaerolineaceae bacterium]|jgi:putative hydrolase of the HAD superfamily
MLFELIAFDADDTLWHSESYYQDTQASLAQLLQPYGVTAETVHDTLFHIETANLRSLGYGAKAFTISMVEAAIQVTGGRIGALEIAEIIRLGKAMLAHDVHLLEHSRESVAQLSQSHPLMIITKGDLIDQQRKLAASGLEHYFQHIEIVSEKTAAVYAGLLQKHQVSSGRFLMIGNSIRSDVLPVLDLGGWAVYVPYHVTWAHETMALPGEVSDRFYEIEHLGKLPALVTHLENQQQP